jgi:hypothetical protein
VSDKRQIQRKSLATKGATMKKADQYHKWVEWSEEDQTYIGRCPDLITGIHGVDPVTVYTDLCEVVEEVVMHFEKSGKPLPKSRTRPMMEMADA